VEAERGARRRRGAEPASFSGFRPASGRWGDLHVLTVPNAISVVRLLLVPVFAWYHLHDRPLVALVIFAVAAISDGIDGLLARLLDQRSPLGAVLDPVADKILGLTALILLVSSKVLPLWFLGVSLLRDAVVLGVVVQARMLRRPISPVPTRVSKYATFTLLTTVTLALFSASPRFGALSPFLGAAGVVAAQCLLVATLQYLGRWRALLRQPRLDP
jgi:cardiolipin synthase